MSVLGQGLGGQVLFLPECFLKCGPGSGSCPGLMHWEKPLTHRCSGRRISKVKKWRRLGWRACKCFIELERALANFRSLSFHSGETEALESP